MEKQLYTHEGCAPFLQSDQLAPYWIIAVNTSVKKMLEF
jgi:hypothetical protein